jgi:hypothetical protein
MRFFAWQQAIARRDNAISIPQAAPARTPFGAPNGGNRKVMSHRATEPQRDKNKSFFRLFSLWLCGSV